MKIIRLRPVSALGALLAMAVSLHAAATEPAPDIDGLVVALLEHEAVAAHSYLSSNRTFRFYVFVNKADPKLAGDPSPEVFKRLTGTGVTFLPGSRWKDPGDVAVGENATLSIHEPLRRANGDYDVAFNFYCGHLCGSINAAVMRHDTSGWHVLSSAMTAIF